MNSLLTMPLTMTTPTFFSRALPPARALAALLALALGQTAAAQPARTDTTGPGRDAMATGDYVGATRNFAEAVRLSPGDASALNNLAVATAAAGDVHGALALLLRARKAAPARADIGHNLARLQGWARHYSDAAPHPVTNGVVSAPPPSLWGAAPLAAAPCEGLACK